VKKSKVDRLIREHSAKARAAGREQGKREERDRLESVLRPDADGYVWLGSPPRSDLLRIPMPQGMRFAHYLESPPPFEHDVCVDFKLKQKGITFSNGVVVRWADWEPIGPYPVHDLATPPRSWR
jgi:hypothetical protein